MNSFFYLEDLEQFTRTSLKNKSIPSTTIDI